MPARKQLITITASGELAQILAVEQHLHPELSPSALVAMLVRRGHEAGDRPRRAVVEGLAGAERYPDGCLEQLRNEWST